MTLDEAEEMTGESVTFLHEAAKKYGGTKVCLLTV